MASFCCCSCASGRKACSGRCRRGAPAGNTGLTRRFGGVAAVRSLDLTVEEGEFVSLIGPNGAGKTTTFNMVSGLDRADEGEILFEGQPIQRLRPEAIAALGIARTFQHGRVFANLSVEDNVLLGAHTRLRAVKPPAPVDRPAGGAGAGAYPPCPGQARGGGAA